MGPGPPAAEPGPLTMIAVSEATDRAGAATILVADDNENTREFLCGILEHEGWTPVEAGDGETAIERVRQHQPDLVLLDVRMPGKGGYQVCEDLRQDPVHDDMPIIFLSAQSDSADKIEGLRRGAIDYISKPFDPEEVVARVRNQLAMRESGRRLRTTNSTLRQQQNRIDEDLRAAGSIQQALLPAGPPAVRGIDVAWRFRPCDQVGGDFFQVEQLDGRHLALYVVDVSGHGIPAAMLTVAVAQTLSPDGNVVKEDRGRGPVRSPSQVVRLLNEAYPIERFERCFTIAYLLLDVSTGRLRYSRAGHPMPLHVRADGKTTALAEGGTVIGLGDALPVEEGELQLAPGDRVFVHSDGVVELANGSGELYGENRLRNTLAMTRRLPLEAACDMVLNSVRCFADGLPFQDDITLVGLQFGVR